MRDTEVWAVGTLMMSIVMFSVAIPKEIVAEELKEEIDEPETLIRDNCNGG